MPRNFCLSYLQVNYNKAKVGWLVGLWCLMPLSKIFDKAKDIMDTQVIIIN